MKSEMNTRRDRIDPLLESLGWRADGNSIKSESANTERERRAQVKADYFLYHARYPTCVAVVEAKKPGRNLLDALQRGLESAQRLREVGSRASVVFATDGVATRARFHDGAPLLINGEEVRDLLPPRVVEQFVDRHHSLVRGEVPRTSQTMVDLFKRASRVLRKEGIVNIGALVEFSQVLFIKIMTELYNDGQRDRRPRVLWGDLAGKAGGELLSFYRRAIEDMREQYPGTFDGTRIKLPETLEKLVGQVDVWSFADAPADVKGRAYEYFLREYSKSKSELGQYFTARHVVRAMVALLKPVYGETVYDPFCGTAGMLIEALEAMKQSKGLSAADATLSDNTFFGGEINPEAAQTAKMNMILAGDGNSGIEQVDSLDPEQANKHHGKREVALSNIPFATNAEVDYFRHCVQSVKNAPSGRFAIIVPERILDSDEEKYVALRRELVLSWNIRRVVSLPREVFRGLTSAKTSFIYAVRGDGNGSGEVPYFKVDNDGLTKDSRRLPLPGRNDLDALIEGRDDDASCHRILRPSENDGFRLSPPPPPIGIATRHPSTTLGELVVERIRKVVIKDDMTVYEPGFRMRGPLRELYLREEKAGYNTRGKNRREILPGDLVVGNLHTQDGMFGIADRVYHSTGTFRAYEVNADRVNPRYLLVSLLHLAKQMQRVDTTGREQYSREDILRLPVALPPMDAQIRIAEQWEDAVRAVNSAYKLMEGATGDDFLNLLEDDNQDAPISNCG